MGSITNPGDSIESEVMDAVYVDDTLGAAGTAYPLGMPSNPVDNIADAVTIAVARNLTKLHIVGTFTFAQAVNGYIIIGESPERTLLTLGNQNVVNCYFYNCWITGVMNGQPRFENCHIRGTTATEGEFINCQLQGSALAPIVFADNTTTNFYDCESQAAGATFDMNGAAALTINMHNFSGIATFVSNTAAGGVINFVSADGDLTLDNTNTLGTYNIYGDVRVTDNSAGSTVNDYSIHTYVDTTGMAVGGGSAAANVNEAQLVRYIADNVGGGTSFLSLYQEVYWVDVANGNDANPGTFALPCLTVQHVHDNVMTNGTPTLVIVHSSTVDTNWVENLTVTNDRMTICAVNLLWVTAAGDNCQLDTVEEFEIYGINFYMQFGGGRNAFEFIVGNSTRVKIHDINLANGADGDFVEIATGITATNVEVYNITQNSDAVMDLIQDTANSTFNGLSVHDCFLYGADIDLGNGDTHDITLANLTGLIDMDLTEVAVGYVHNVQYNGTLTEGTTMTYKQFYVIGAGSYTMVDNTNEQTMITAGAGQSPRTIDKIRVDLTNIIAAIGNGDQIIVRLHEEVDAANSRELGRETFIKNTSSGEGVILEGPGLTDYDVLISIQSFNTTPGAVAVPYNYVLEYP